MSETAIRISRVSKHFKLYDDPVMGPIREWLTFWKKPSLHRKLTTVRDVTLEIPRGQVVGVVGPNGAGKTTLLKMVAGLLPIDEGAIEVRGKVTALLALGVGVHPEFTGKENALYGGMLLGMSKAEVLRKLPGIIEFAELGDFINRPFRTYSSGMKARLLFSVAMAVDPNILIVDEALATGDSYFVQKCTHKIREVVSQSGATVLFVSHNLGQLRDLCQRLIVMEQGAVVYDGQVHEGIEAYGDAVQKRMAAELASHPAKHFGTRKVRGNGSVELLDTYVKVNGQRTTTVHIGEPCELVVELRAKQPLRDIQVGLRLGSHKSQYPVAYVPPVSPLEPGVDDACLEELEGDVRVTFAMERYLGGDGPCRLDVIVVPREHYFSASAEHLCCSVEAAASFVAVYRDMKQFGRGSLVELPLSQIRVQKLEREHVTEGSPA